MLAGPSCVLSAGGARAAGEAPTGDGEAAADAEAGDDADVDDDSDSAPFMVKIYKRNELILC